MSQINSFKDLTVWQASDPIGKVLHRLVESLEVRINTQNE
jgi:hypothetical protein